ncbi:MAG: hypothetical protein L3K26_05965, partial [Candidatus Hydrogenedentes bacterium]|nr:hypothetical protein [Candidatus Hydrogenedentota bacterium]
MTQQFRSRMVGIFCVISTIALTTSVYAEIVFENAVVSTQVSVFLSSADIRTQHDDSDTGPRALTEFPLTASATDSASEAGLSASGNASQNAILTIDSETGVLSGDISGDFTASSSVGDPNREQATANTSSSFRLFFEIVDASATLVVNGSLATGSGLEICDSQATYMLQQSGAGELSDLRACSLEFLDDGSTPTRSIDETRLLDPGRYLIAFSAGGIIHNTSATGSFDVQFTITPGSEMEPPPTVVFWEGLDGNFDDETNWEPQVVPDSDITAVFDKDAGYTVTIDEATSLRVLVERGAVDFVNGSYEVFGGDEESASIVVGSTSADTPALTLKNHTLVVNYGTIGDGAGTIGALNVENTGASWNVQDRLTIGKGGVGNLVVANGATGASGETLLAVEANSVGTFDLTNTFQGGGALPLFWTSGSMNVGVGGLGVVRIDGARMNSGAVTLGVELGSTGEAIVGLDGEEGGSGSAGSWDMESGGLIVGDQGTGTLTVKHGSSAGPGFGDVLIGKQPGSTGTVLVTGTGEFPSSFGTIGSIVVGMDGTGSLRIEEGATVGATEMSVGANEGGEGTVVVTGNGGVDTPSNLSLFGTLFVGPESTGVLTVEEGASVDSTEGRIGTFSGGDGTVSVDNATWTITETLGIGASVDNNGELQAVGIANLLFGVNG